MKPFTSENSDVASSDTKPWMKLAGCAANDPEMLAELKRIEKIIEQEFGVVDEKDWE